MVHIEDAADAATEEDDEPLLQRADADRLPDPWPDLFPLRTTENTWIIAWGVRDSYDRVTKCATAQDAREYQAAHGGRLVSREAIHTYWAGTSCQGASTDTRPSW
jgi:hypothetical protein